MSIEELHIFQNLKIRTDNSLIWTVNQIYLNWIIFVNFSINFNACKLHPKNKTHFQKKKKIEQTTYISLYSMWLSPNLQVTAQIKEKKEINHHFITPCVHNPDQAINNCNLLI